MMKIYFRTLFLSLFALVGISKESFAIYATKTCDDANGLMCWQCGANCTATLYNGGELVISGTGAVNGQHFNTFSNNPNLPQDVTSVKIKEGITSVENNAFYGVGTITKIELADSVSSIGPDGFNLSRQYQLIISENSNITYFDSGYNSANRVSSVFCRGNVETCRPKLEAANSKFANKNITDELRDADGKLLEKCSSSGCEKYDSNGHVSAKYDLSGNLLEEYKYDSGGNLLASYQNGVSTYKRTSYTPAEAAKAIKKGNNNKVTLTFK